MSKVAKMREKREADARRQRLKALESTIEKSAQAVWDMAEALKEIREDELWKETHDSWTAYCEDRWGIDYKWANKTIQAIEVRRQLSSDASRRPPKHVKHASELASVPEDDRRRVWSRAVEKAEADGKSEPSLHRHLTPAIREYKQDQEAAAPKPSPEERRASEAHEAASQMRSSAETFLRRVELLMPHLDNLPPDQVQSCAYGIVKTVHDVMATLEEHGHVRGDVAGAVLDAAPSNEGEIVVS